LCRNKEVKPSCVDEDSPALNKISSEIEDALDWMRNDGVSPDDADSLGDFSMIESIPDPVEHLKSERRTLRLYYIGFASRRYILSFQPGSSRRSTKYVERRKAKRARIVPKTMRVPWTGAGIRK
jgi:hypothetical protein